MNVDDFFMDYKNHPVLFVGTGFSLRYLQNSFTWDGLLSKISSDLTDNEEDYYDLKGKYSNGNYFDFPKIASELEIDFNSRTAQDRHGKFKSLNDYYYDSMRSSKPISRFKFYISELLSNLTYRDETKFELAELKKASKNIGSIITTNYDLLIEDIFKFNPLIGNDILLSNPYGSVYKIHGCITNSEKIIITQNDYDHFFKKYELIRAQLLSMFIHNPIIFLGYGVGDNNIKEILKTIFTYVEPNSETAAVPGVTDFSDFS